MFFFYFDLQTIMTSNNFKLRCDLTAYAGMELNI